MSRRKKSRSLKNNHNGLKTGSKERMKIESKQRKAAKKAANPRKVTRQRSVYQQLMDKNGSVEAQHVNAPSPSQNRPAMKAPATNHSQPAPQPMVSPVIEPAVENEAQAIDLWDQLESPQNSDIF